MTELNKQEFHVANDNMIIKACFIKSSDIDRIVKQSTKAKGITVYSCQAIHFNMDLELVDVESFTIISPKWSILHNIKIFSTRQIPVHRDSKAPNGVKPGHAGVDGLPGLSGKNGGNFYGYGIRFTNLGELLKF